MRKIRLLVADDHVVVRDGLRMVFKNHPQFTVVAEAANGSEAVSLAGELKPDVAILDISMPVLNGIEAAGQLRDLGVNSKVVFLTMHRDVAYARRAMEAGAAGFVLKHSVAS